MPRSPASSLPATPHLTKALYCRHNVLRTGNVCACARRVFPFVFSSSIAPWLVNSFGPTEISRPPAHVFERHLFILKMQMWPTSKTDRQEKTHGAKGEVSNLEPCPSLYHTQITSCQNHLTSSRNLSEGPTIQMRRLISPKTS